MRFVRAAASAVTLLLLLVGAPMALLATGRLQALASLDWSHILTVRDDGTLLLGLLTALGWVVWAVLAASIVIELVDAVRRRQHHTAPALEVPGLDLPRALVRGLVVAVVAAVITSVPAPHHPQLEEPVAPVAAQAAAAVGVREQPAPAARVEPVALPGDVHVVQPGDDLWALAVDYYGDGTRWRQIADANPDLVTADRDLQPGTSLLVPSESASPTSLVVVVKKGDTLWDLARTHLGDPERWPEIYEANRDIIDDPDLIDIGWRLRIPVVATKAPATTQPAQPVQKPASTTPTPAVVPAGTQTTATPSTTATSRPTPSTTAPPPAASTTAAPTARPETAPAQTAPTQTASSTAPAQGPSARPTPVPATSTPATTSQPTAAPAAERAAQPSAGSVISSSNASARVTPAGVPATGGRVAQASGQAPTAVTTTPSSAPAPSPGTSSAPTSSTSSGPSATPSGAPSAATATATSTSTAPSTPGTTVSAPSGSVSAPVTTTPAVPTATTAPAPKATAPSNTAPQGSTPARPSAEAATPASTSRPATATPSPTPAAATPEQHAANPFGFPGAPAAAIVGGVGAVLAGGLVAQMRRRRTLQLAVRPVGRRILQPGEDASQIATALGQVSDPALLTRVDTLTRSLGTSRLTGNGALLLAGPDGVTVTDAGGAAQRYSTEHLDAMQPGGAEHDPETPAADRPAADPSPLPALVALGSDTEGRQVLLDLEAAGMLTIELDDPLPTCVAVGLEVACSPWAEGVTVVASGQVGAALPAELENVVQVHDGEVAAKEALQRVATQRRTLETTGLTLADMRDDPDTRDAWGPHVYLFGPDLDPHTAARLRDSLLGGPPVAVAVVVAGRDAVPGRAAKAESIAPGEPRRAAEGVQRGVRVTGTGSGARLDPYALAFEPQRLPQPIAAVVAQLLAVTGSDETTPAPWFSADDGVVPLHPSTSVPTKEAVLVGPPTAPGVTDFSHPTLLLLGPIELVGAAGPPPPRAERSCIEYCAWLLEHPGATATAMANSLVIAEGTRRSNVSRLRSWLGQTDEGDQYLPDAYNGRLNLDPCVSSDWHRLQMLIMPGINRVSRETLVAALQLVRGAPLADAAPGQWHWAEELRTDMSSTIRDIGVLVAEGAIEDGDVDLARWATARALTAAPEDELLLCSRLKAEHRAGNRSEVERIALRLTRHARVLGIDLADETVRLIQEVIEGRPRARA